MRTRRYRRAHLREEPSLLFKIAAFLLGVVIGYAVMSLARADDADVQQPVLHKGMKAVMHVLTVNVNTLDIEAAQSLFFKSEHECRESIPVVEMTADRAVGPDYAVKATCATVQRVNDDKPAGTSI